MVSSSFTKRFLSGRTWIVLLVVAAFLLGFLIRGGGGDRGAESTHAEADHQEPTVWTCSMHPQIKLPKAGQCPICFMDLIPLEDDAGDELGPRSLVLSEAAAALAEIQTVPVVRQTVAAEVRLTGKVDYDETRYRIITAWVPGRIDTLFVDYTGTTVRKGERLVSLYSPELYAAQVELFNALTAERELQASDQELMRRTATATVASARERLRLWGLTERQVVEIERRGSPSQHLTIRSPLSGIVVHKDAVEGMYVQTGSHLFTVADLSRVWVSLDAYESDLAWLAEGQTIDFTVEAVPGRAFAGTIVFIDPVLDDKTRTVMVRLDVENDEGLLKPGMFVNATAGAGLSGDGQALAGSSSGQPPLVIPASAPLITGKRAVAYVRLPDREQPTFEGREIVLGPRAGDVYLVESGLQEGELVVVKGNFKLDSALQIQAKPSMMSPAGGDPAPGHQHGAGEETQGKAGHTDQQEAETETPIVFEDSPADFLAQLGGVLDAYLEIQTALAGDDDKAARKAAGKTADALQAVDMALLGGEAHLAWMDDLAELRKSQAALQEASDIASRREKFLPLSEALWKTLRRFGYRREQTVRLIHCPMAFSSAGADWLQLDATVANPYYGASMLRCGSQTDSLAALAENGARVGSEGGR